MEASQEEIEKALLLIRTLSARSTPASTTPTATAVSDAATLHDAGHDKQVMPHIHSDDQPSDETLQPIQVDATAAASNTSAAGAELASAYLSTSRKFSHEKKVFRVSGAPVQWWSYQFSIMSQSTLKRAAKECRVWGTKTSGVSLIEICRLSLKCEKPCCMEWQWCCFQTM